MKADRTTPEYPGQHADGVRNASRAANAVSGKVADAEVAREVHLEQSTDPVDAASEASFPASDPPTWSAVRLGPPTERMAVGDEQR